MSEQKRGKEYYLQRLKKVSPTLYRDVMAGRMTVGAARKLARLGGSRTRLQEMQNAWSKGTPADRADFLSWAGVATVPTPPVGSTITAWDSEGRLLRWARLRIPEIKLRRGLSPSQVSDELGTPRLDTSLRMAITRGTKVRSAATAAAVDRWLVANAKV